MTLGTPVPSFTPIFSEDPASGQSVMSPIWRHWFESLSVTVSIGNASTLEGFTWASPGALGSTTPNLANFTTVSIGTPLSITSGGTGNTLGKATINANLTGPITSVGNATSVASQTGTGSTFVMQASPTISGHPTIEGVTSTGATGTGNLVFSLSPTLTTPNLGTPTTLVGTNITGTAAGLTAGTVTTNANLTGVITSIGNATSIASQTGTGTKFVVDTSPTIITPTISGHFTAEGVTSTGATGTGKLVFDTSPSFTTPALGTPSALVGTNITGTAAALNIGGTATQATNLTGRTAGSSPSAGNAGEHPTTGTGSSVSLTNATATNVASIPLPAGNWLVFGSGTFNFPGASSAGALFVTINNASATFPSAPYYAGLQFTATNETSIPAPTRYFSSNASFTVYLIMQANYSGAALTGTAYIDAIRMP